MLSADTGSSVSKKPGKPHESQLLTNGFRPPSRSGQTRPSETQQLLLLLDRWKTLSDLGESLAFRKHLLNVRDKSNMEK